MAKLKKRSKKSRLHGRKTCGYGSRKKHRGKGSVGGRGMSGTGKRADQKKTLILRKGVKYFGRKRKLLKRTFIDVINVSRINENIERYIKEGKAKKTNEGIELDLKNMKVLGDGEIDKKVMIKAKSASKSAVEKVEKAGGRIIIEE